jgi:hypothetical protein
VELSRPEEVLAALAEEKPSRLIGTRESAQIDFKKQPYQLTTDKGKWELAKDVAGLANLTGGVLVIGVRAEKTEGNFREVATELRPVTVAELNREKYHSVIRDQVRPAVDFEVEYFPDPDQAGKGYMTIYVKPLPEAERYALVRRMVTDDGQQVDSMGVPVRDSDQTRWLSADEVYRLLRDGQRANSPPRAEIRAHSIDETLNWDEAVDRLVELKDWDDPLLIWQSMPLTSADLLPRMWGKESISQTLTNPPSLRPNGFNWDFFTEVTQFDGGALASDGRRAIWVAPNGTVTAAAIVSDEMLTWAMHNRPGQPQRLNVIAVVELTLEYFRLVDEHIILGEEVDYRHSIATRKFAGSPPVVLPEGLPNFVSSFSERSVSQDTRYKYDEAIPADAERDAYEALWRLYASFQLGPERVPFAGDGRIDASKLLEWLKARR